MKWVKLLIFKIIERFKDKYNWFAVPRWPFHRTHGFRETHLVLILYTISLRLYTILLVVTINYYSVICSVYGHRVIRHETVQQVFDEWKYRESHDILVEYLINIRRETSTNVFLQLHLKGSICTRITLLLS